MRNLLLIPIGVTLAATCVAAISGSAHARDVELASAIVGTITIAACAGVVMARRSTIESLFQIALAASVGQLMLTAFAALIVWMSGFAGAFQNFAIALLIFYWLHLVVLSMVSIRVIRAAASHTTPAS